MGQFQKDKLNSMLNGKAIEDRITKYPIFDKYEKILIDFVNDIQNRIHCSNTQGCSQMFAVSVDPYCISIITKNPCDVGDLSVSIHFVQEDMEMLNKLSQMNAICSVLKKRTESAFLHQLSCFNHTVHESVFKENTLPKQEFRFTVSMKNNNYQASMKW